jgi:conjugal transfer/entry exclusion protein
MNRIIDKEKYMKFFKITAIAVSFGLFAATGASAQLPVVQNVLDVANLMQAIDTLYATYDQIANTIEQVQNTYKQIENQVKAIQNINFDDISKLSEIKDIDSLEDFSNFRHNIKDAVSNVNYNMNLFNDLKDTMDNKQISIGGAKFTVASLVGKGREGEKTIFDLPKVTADYLKEQAESSIAGWANKLTPDQRTAVMNKWGMSPRNYATWQMAVKITDAAAGALFGYGEAAYRKINEQVAARNAAIRQQLVLAGESTNGKLDTLTESVLALNRGFLDLHNVFAQVGDLMASQYYEKGVREQAEAAQRAAEEDTRQKEYDDSVKRMYAVSPSFTDYENLYNSLPFQKELIGSQY